MGRGEAAKLARKQLSGYEAKAGPLRDALERGILDSIPNTELNGHPELRLANPTNITFHGIESEALLLLLDQEGVCVLSSVASFSLKRHGCSRMCVRSNGSSKSPCRSASNGTRKLSCRSNGVERTGARRPPPNNPADSFTASVANHHAVSPHSIDGTEFSRHFSRYRLGRHCLCEIGLEVLHGLQVKRLHLTWETDRQVDDTGRVLRTILGYGVLRKVPSDLGVFGN